MTSEEDKKEILYKYVKDYYWSTFRRNSTILSSTCRQLALGLGGLAWLDKANTQTSCCSKAILIFIVLFFISDAAQYLLQAYAFYNLAEEYDTKIENDIITEKSELVEKTKMNLPTHVFFIIKLTLLGLAAALFLILGWKFCRALALPQSFGTLFISDILTLLIVRSVYATFLICS